MSVTGVFFSTILLFYGAKLTVVDAVCMPDDLKCSPFSLSHAASLKEAQCPSASTTSCDLAVDGIADSSNAHQWMLTSTTPGDHWFILEFIAVYRVNKIRLKQLSIDYEQYKDVQLEFAGPTYVTIQLGIQGNDSQTFRFAARNTHYITFRALSFYSTGTKAAGYQEIEVYHENCGESLMCERITVDSSAITDRSKDLVAYPLNGKFVSFQLRLSVSPSEHRVGFNFVEKKPDGNPSRTWSLGLVFTSTSVDFTAVSDSDEMANSFAFPVNSEEDFTFWVDFSASNTFLFGVGNLTYSHTVSLSTRSISHVSIEPDAGTIVVAGICSPRDESCKEEAAHHWPMDKLSGGDLLDIIGDRHGTMHGGVLVNTGPVMHTGFTTSAVALDSTKNEYINLGDFAGSRLTNSEYWDEGWTFAFWIRFDTLNTTAITALDDLFSVDGSLKVRRSNSKGLHVSVYTHGYKYVVSGTAELLLSVWYHVTITWDPLEKLAVYHNVVGKFPFTVKTSMTNPSSDSNFYIRCPAENNCNSDSISVADVVFWNKRLSDEEIARSFQCSGYKLGQPNSVGIGTGRILNSGLTASSQRKTTTGLHAASLARSGLLSSGAGSWMPSFMDVDPFLQVDLSRNVVVTEVGVQGDPNEDKWVSSYSLSYKANVSPWKFVLYTAGQVKAWIHPTCGSRVALELDHLGGTTTELQGALNSSFMVSNVLSPSITTRFLRFHPISWVGGIAMRIEVFTDRPGDDYKGCFNDPALTALAEVDLSTLTPGTCIEACGKAGKTVALLRAGSQCFCDTSVPTSSSDEVIDDSLCSMPCYGNPGLPCGGINHVAAYQVQGTAASTFSLTIPAKVNLFTNFSFSVAELPEENYFVDFDNGLAMRSSQTSMYSAFPSLGIYNVKAWSQTGNYGEPALVSAQSVVEVVAPVSASFQCPPAVETLTSFDCTLDIVQGSDAPFDVDFFDGKATTSDVLTETLQGVVGCIAADGDNSSLSDGVYLYPTPTFAATGVIHGWEVLATKSGVLRLLVTRPVCLFNTSESYITADGSAITAPECTPKQSTTSEMLCMEAEVSIAGTSTCEGLEPKSLATSHEIVHEYIAYVHVGRNLLSFETSQLGELPFVGPGYGLAVDIPEGIGAEVAVTQVGTNAEYFFSNGSSPVGTILEESSGQKSSGSQLLVKAYYFASSTQVITESYTNVGVFQPRVRFTVDGNNVDFLSTIVVSEPIEGGNWTVTPNTYVATNGTVDVVIEALTRGYNVTVVLTYEPGDNETVIQERITAPMTYQHIYRTRGMKPLSLSYANALSTQEFGCNIHVQDTILGLSLVDPISPKETGNTTEIAWFLPQGSDLTFDFDLGDGTLYSNGTFDIDGVLIVFASHVYYAPGEYDVNITAYNGVSSLTLMTLAVVEDAILNMTVEVVHSARDIEVDETIGFNVTMLNGTNALYYVDFGDGSSVESWNGYIEHAYTYWQDFEVNITVRNNVSIANITIVVTVHKPVEPLIGFVVTAPPTNLTDPSPFMLNITNGTDYNCTWDFGDGNKGENDFDDLGKYLYHTFAAIDAYDVFVNCTNRLYETNISFVAVVQEPILGFTFPEPGAVKCDQDLPIAWTMATGTNATYNVTFENVHVNNGVVLVQNPDLILSTDRTTGSYVFQAPSGGKRMPGVYLVTITVWNLVTPPQIIRWEVAIDEPITDALLTSADKYWEVNTTVTVKTTMSLGTNVTLKFNFTDGTVVEEFFLGEFPAEGVETTHVFQTDGDFLVELLVINSVTNFTLTLPLVLQYVPDLALLSNSPQVHQQSATIEFFLVVNPGKEAPSDANSTWNFGDGHSLTEVFDFNETHTYAEPGWYPVVVTIFNEIGETNITGYADVQRLIVNPRIWCVNTAGDRGDGAVGAGPNQNIFPQDYPVRFMTHVDDGTNVTYYFDFGDGSSGSANETIEYQFGTPGHHVINVVANNSVSEMRLTVEIYVEAVVKDITIINDSPTVIGKPMTFDVKIGQIGNNSCFYIDLKNGSKVTFKPELTDTCADLAFSSDIRSFTGKNFSFTHIYSYVNEYIVTVNGMNDASSVLTDCRAVSVGKPCFFPKAVVIESGKNVTTARKFIKSKDIVIPTENVIDCEAAIYSKFQWRVYLYDPTRPHIPPGENETTFYHEMANVSKITYDAPRLVVKARGLDYGIYKAAENVSMVGVVGVWDDDEGYFEVIKSPINARIIGGSARSIGFGKNFTLDANSSGDPDVEVGDRQGIQVYWLCKRKSDNYMFPDDPENLTALSMVPLLSQANGSNATDPGGCFGRGPGLLDFNGYVMKLFSGNLMINETYQFRFFIRKDERTAYYDSEVLIVEGDPPEMAISCQLNCLRKFNPSEKITVEAICVSCTAFSRRMLVLRWSLAVQENDVWVNVDLASIAKSPLDRDILVIGAGTLTGGKNYRIRIDGRFSNGPSGFSELIKVVNLPPNGGSCDCLPKEGYAMKNIFTVQCVGWEDTESPLRYGISYRNGPDGLRSGIYDGMDSVRSEISMPLGIKEHDHNLTIYVDIRDSLGAFTTVETTIKVLEEKVSDDAFASMMDDMTSDSGALGNLIAEGNAQAMVQFVGSLTSLLNNKAAPDEPVVPTTQSSQDDGNQGPPLSPAEQARLEEERIAREEEEKRKAEEARRKRMEAREKMVSAMASVQIDSVTTVQQTSSALQSLLSTPDEVSPNAQSAASAAMANMADFMLSNAGSSSGSALESAASGLVTGLGHMVSASSGSVAKSASNDSGSGLNETASKELAKSVVAAIEAATDKIFQALASRTSLGEDPIEIDTPAMSLATVKKSPAEMAGPLKCGGGGFGMPAMGSDGNDSDASPVDMKGVGTSDNAYSWDKSASSVQTKVMSLQLRNASGDVIPVSNLSEPISIFASTGQPPGKPTRHLISHKRMMFNTLTVDKNDTSLHFEITPEHSNAEFIVYLKRGSRPTPTDYDYTQVIPDDTGLNATFPKGRYVFYVSNNATNRTTSGKWYLGILYNGTLEPEYKQIEGTQERKLYIPLSVNYTLLMFASGCIFWDKVDERWSGDGCVVGPQTKVEEVQCLCTHLTSFAGDFFVMPNAIDWDAISLDNLFSNPTVFAVVMTIFGLYIIGMIWCRKKDKEDLQQIGTTPLPDNDPRDTYLYEIVFFTGHSPGAGTTANVYMVMEGTIDETPPRAMKDPVRKKFGKSAVDTFLLAVPSSLGRLKNFRIWHDNSGESPGWFLQRVLVQDMQTDKKTWFLCDNWLAVEEDDGLIERTLVPATREDLTGFHLLFSTEARKSLTDNHLWFSVVKRPPRSTFTRCQRLSCCLTIILTTMLANAMFFQTDSTSSTGTEIRAGPISFSVKQISIAITSSMVVLPANILIVSLFRKAGPKKPKKATKEKGEKYSTEDGEQEKEEKKAEVINVENEEDEVDEVDENGKKKKKKKKKKKSDKLPHWVIYVAYVVVAIASLVSATFTVFYGLTFGEEKSQKWIMTMMISFWQDVLISQPLKVFAAATFFALVIKNPDKVAAEEDEQKKDGSKIKPDEELVHKKDEKNEEDEMADIKKLAFMPKPPDPVKLEEMRRFKLQQKQMYKIIKEILSYLVFVMILLTVAYGNRDPKSHNVNNALTSYFIDGTYGGRMSLGDISDINGFYKYLRGSLLPTLKPEFWYGPYDASISKVKNENDDEIYAYSSPGYNGSKVYHEVHRYPKGYVADRANAWLVGIPRIRQLRVIDRGCVFPKGVDHLIGRCSKPYSFDNEEEGYYEPGWIPMNESKIKKIKDDKWFKSPWSYKTGWQLKGTPYWGFFHTYWSGGYVAELSASYEYAVNQSKELESLNWLDGKTRAVFFEFTVYNPFTNFFATVNILVEILATGGYYPYPYISTTRLYRYIGAEAKVIMALELVFFGYLLYYIVREGKELKAIGRKAYLRDLWNYFDMLVIICSIVSIVFYFMRLVGTKIAINRFKEDPYSFINFNYVFALDEMVTTFMALTVFISFLKFLRLLRFNRRIGMLASTLKACIKPLASFFLLFIIVFLAYAQFAFLMFGQEMSDYSSFDRCLSNMLGMTLGSFDFHALESANRILGPIFFFSYILMMVMILMNVFLSIINDTFNDVNADISKQSSDSDIADFMMDRLVATIKRTGATVKPIYKEPKDRLDQSLEDIEDLSENVQLVMRNLCLESIRHTSWFKSEDLEESKKKRQILELLMLTGENFTESEICDAIPVLDTVLAKYSSEELMHITKKYQEKLVREEKEDADELAREEKKVVGEEADKESVDSNDSDDTSDSEGSDGERTNDIKFDF